MPSLMETVHARDAEERRLDDEITQRRLAQEGPPPRLLSSVVNGRTAILNARTALQPSQGRTTIRPSLMSDNQRTQSLNRQPLPYRDSTPTSAFERFNQSFQALNPAGRQVSQFSNTGTASLVSRDWNTTTPAPSFDNSRGFEHRPHPTQRAHWVNSNPPASFHPQLPPPGLAPQYSGYPAVPAFAHAHGVGNTTYPTQSMCQVNSNPPASFAPPMARPPFVSQHSGYPAVPAFDHVHGLDNAPYPPQTMYQVNPSPIPSFDHPLARLGLVSQSSGYPAAPAFGRAHGCDNTSYPPQSMQRVSSNTPPASNLPKPHASLSIEEFTAYLARPETFSNASRDPNAGSKPFVEDDVPGESLPEMGFNIPKYRHTEDAKDIAPHRRIITVSTVPLLEDALLRFGRMIENGAAELFLDEESGPTHGENGKLSTIQVTFASSSGLTLIFDVISLGQMLFHYVASNGKSLKMILEDPKIVKVFFDIRADSAALYHQYGITLRGAIDEQLMELASRVIEGKTFLKGLDTCVKSDLNLTPKEKEMWDTAKKGGSAYLNGDYTKWEDRPLPPQLLEYAANDTVYMPQLYSRYLSELKASPFLMRTVLVESARRIAQSQVKGFEISANGPPKAFMVMR